MKAWAQHVAASMPLTSPNNLGCLAGRRGAAASASLSAWTWTKTARKSSLVPQKARHRLGLGYVATEHNRVELLTGGDLSSDVALG